MGHGVRRVGRAVIEGHLTVRERRRHADPVAGAEVGIVVLPFRLFGREVGRRFFIAGQHGIDVLRAADAVPELVEGAIPAGTRLGDERQVGRGSAAVRRLRRFHVGERRREGVGGKARTVEHFAAGVGAVLHGVGGGERLHLFFREDAAFSQVAELHEPHGVAVGTDFLVDLVAALQLLAVEFAEWAFEGEIDVLRGLLAFRRHGAARERQQTGREANQGE